MKIRILTKSFWILEGSDRDKNCFIFVYKGILYQITVIYTLLKKKEKHFLNLENIKQPVMLL